MIGDKEIKNLEKERQEKAVSKDIKNILFSACFYLKLNMFFIIKCCIVWCIFVKLELFYIIKLKFVQFISIFKPL